MGATRTNANDLRIKRLVTREKTSRVSAKRIPRFASPGLRFQLKSRAAPASLLLCFLFLRFLRGLSALRLGRLVLVRDDRAIDRVHCDFFNPGLARNADVV